LPDLQIDEAAMREIRKFKTAVNDQYTENENDLDERPRRIPGDTITSRNGSPEIDRGSLFEWRADASTVAGSSNSRVAMDTVALADGTQVTFSCANQFRIVLTT
jgi:hypothetical protein